MNDEFIVNGLPLPPLLVSLLQQGKWKHPGETIVRAVIPFIEDPLYFCPLATMRSETMHAVRMSEEPDTFFRQAAGSQTFMPLDMPWLDVEMMVFIAVNKNLGDDVGIALDYRASRVDPRVVASDWLTDGDGCFWHQVTPTFTEFVERLGLK